MNTSLSAPDRRQGLDPLQPSWWDRFVRPKGHIGQVGLSLLILLACAPFIMAFARLLAYPGMQPLELIGLNWLQQLGSLLNQSFTLDWVPPGDRWTILYLLLLPTAALLITLARLTFGLRVLGFRAILIAVGFQEIGIIPSLALIAIVVATIVLVRPAMRRIRLPLYARISVILCISAIIMVGALFVGPWLRSESIWSVAFFPVIILAMLAESIAKTVDRENALTGAWRAVTTVAVAFLIAWISQTPAIREFALRFPELMLTQLVAIVFISEFLDFRLLQSWQAGLGKPANGTQGGTVGQTRVAVVRNRWNMGVIGRLGVSASTESRTQSVQRIVDALRDEGFTVKVFEGDMSLLRELREFLPSDPGTGAPGGLVLNLAKGIQGNGRFSHLPSMLEMSGVAYTGPDPIGHVRMLDRYILLSLLQQAGVPVPRFKLIADGLDDTGDLQFPLAVRPRCEPDLARTIVKDRRELDTAVQRLVQQYAQEALVEEFLSSPEIRVSLLGNETIECLPLLQVDSAGNGKICPAPIDDALADQIRNYAQRAYVVAGCRDYARVDARLTQSGKPRIVQIQSLGILARKGSFTRSAEAGGYSFQNLMRRIVEVAWIRYAAEPCSSVKRGSIGKMPMAELQDGRAVAR